MQFKAIGRVTVRHLRLEIGWQVDDVNGIEWTFLRTDTTSDAESFGDEGDLAVGSDFDAQLARPNDRARFLTFLSALARSTYARSVTSNQCGALSLPIHLSELTMAIRVSLSSGILTAGSNFQLKDFSRSQGGGILIWWAGVGAQSKS